jgi:hypothetical protein
MASDGRNIIMYVYIFVSTDLEQPLWKIGYSNDPKRRLMEIQTGCPFTIKEYDRIKCKNSQHARAIEKHVHFKLSPHKYRGGSEWYHTRTEWMDTILFEVRTKFL